VTFDALPMHVFDVEAHRGGAGLWPENTLEAFGRALALGVSTLELDVHLTAEDDVVVAHDPTVHGGLADARRIRELTRADLPPTMPLLRQVAALLDERGAEPVRVNLEIKYDALDASGLTTREEFVDRVVDALRIDRMVGRTSIQCFDWGVLRRVGEAESALARNLLVSPKYLRGADGVPSPWFDGLAVDADFVRTAATEGFTAISPIHGSPYMSGVDDPAYRPFATEALVDEAHEAGLLVVPYVVDDEPTMRHLVRIGADGLITNHPERLRDVLTGEGRDLPPAFPGGAGNLPPVPSVSPA